MDNYDPTDPRTWPNWQLDFSYRVITDLYDGKTQSLAEYIRAGLYLDRTMAIEVADMLDSKEGLTPCQLKAVRRTKDPRGFREREAEQVRRAEIGAWVDAEIRNSPRGAFVGILEEACERFGVKKTTVTDALREHRANLKASHGTVHGSLFDRLSGLIEKPPN